ncbi:MAG TPA: AAA family ATPase [Polyangiaceae bacterium]|nr:AAA family ATPase [Polyangiaceae bacterium]
MKGRLGEFDLAQVLQVVGIGRQYTGVELHSGSSLAGTIFIKSGKVVYADASGAKGRDAFMKLFRQSDGSFYVYRMPPPEPLPEPIGPLHRLLMEALSQTANDPIVETDADAFEAEAPTRSGVAPPAPGSAPVETTQVRERPVPPLPARTRSVPAKPEGRNNHAVHRSSGPAPAASPARAQRAPSTGSGAVQGRAVEPRRIVAVVSPKGGCGKTTVSLNLALSLARQGRSVVLVDADVNGDVLSSINARERAQAGVYDVLSGTVSPEDALLKTVLPGFELLPATGGALPDPSVFAADYSAAWQRLLNTLAARAELVIVDTPAGMFGVTHQVLSASTHVLGVLQAEILARRSFGRFTEGLDALPPEHRPDVVGVFLNMLQTRHSASMSVFQEAMSDLPPAWLFETTIPRSAAFLDASFQGVPLRHIDEQAPPAVAFLFDNLAAEVAERLHLPTPERRPQPLLV